jgi:TolB-like protein/class 3 adenylate cyclase/cytochrome c-type biogenesis protein CcmH/NrfG
LPERPVPETDPASARRLAAVLSADVAGYVRLMRADEHGTHRRLATCMTRVLEPLVADHGGRIVADTGDGAIAEFPSASMAVRCALAVHRGVAAVMADEPAEGRLAFRIGIALGEVRTKPGGIYGDVVNLAVRLQGEADPGGVCVSGTVCEQACGPLAATARFAAMGTRALKHVSEPVTAWRVWPAAAGDADNAPGPKPAWEGPAVAVLPFEVLGDAAEDRWFADGLADDLIAALGAWGWFPVIARQSSFCYRGAPTPAQRVARDLGAGYLVEGTFRRAAGRLRVNVRLVNGGSGRQLWAGGCERPAGHLFEVQDELLLGIAGRLETELAHRERDRAAAVGRAGDLDAYLALQRGLWHQSQWTATDAAEARRLFREAIAIDPHYARAWGALARATAIAAENGWTNAPRRSGFAEAFDLAREAVRLDGGSGESWYSLGEAHLLAEVGWDECLAAFERALSCNPSHVASRARLATPLACTGRPAEAVRAAELALRLSPRDPRASVWLSGLSVSRYLLGDYEAAAAAARQSLMLRPDWAPVHHPLAASLARLGRHDEAAEVFARLLRLEPDAMERSQHFAQGFKDRSAGEHLLEGLRLAGAGR